MGKNVVIVVALLAAGFFAAFLRFRPHLGLEAAYTDGVHTYDSAAGEDIRFAVWDAPELLSDEVNSEARELRPALSPDGRYLVFSSGERGLNADLFLADIEGGEPREARPLFELCSDFDELAPAFSNEALYFASNRPGGEGGLDVWRSEYHDGAFGEPVALNATVNTDAEESDPAPVPGSRAFAFASDREGDWDLYLARPAVAGTRTGDHVVEVVNGVNSPSDEREPALTSDGLALFFASDREGGVGGFDLWRSVFEDGAWLAPELVRGVNTEASERGPLPSRDGFTLLFSYEEDELAADLYRAHSRELFRLPGRPVGWVDLVVLTSLLLLALLAWLAKRWKQLEVLYKCFLVSAAAHIALLLWFQYVDVEGGAAEVPGRSALFRVRLASAPTADSALRARGGELETERTDERKAGEPEREEPAPMRESDRRVRAAPSRSLAAESAPVHPVPQRAVAPPVTPDRRLEPARSAVALEDAEALPERRERAAQTLELTASALFALPSSRPVTAPARASAPAHATRQASALAEPAAARGKDLARRPQDTVTEPRRALPQAARVAKGPARAARVARVAVAQPSEEHVRRESAVGQVALFEPQASARPDRRPPTPTRGRASSKPLVQRLDPGAATPLVRRVAESVPAESASVAHAIPPASRIVRSVEVVDRARVSTSTAFRELPELVLVPEPPVREARPAVADAQVRDLAVEASDVGSERRKPELRPIRHRPTVAQVEPGAPRPTELAARERRGDAGESSVSRKLELTPYRSRFGLAKERALREYGGGRETEAAVAKGLAYLASIQSTGGYWGNPRELDDKYYQVSVGKSALSLLAFLGAGHTPVSKTQYSELAERALRFLLSTQDEDTGHFGLSTSYSHGVTTYALAECFAITEDRRLRRPLERAVDWILANQHEDGGSKRGGWGYYYPNDRRWDDWPRVSVTSWQVMALESARLGGLAVPDRAFTDARRFLRRSYDERGWFRYSQDPERLGSGYPTLPGSTPAGLFALSLLGDDLTHGRWRDAVEFVVERAPDGYRYTSDDAFVFRARGNLYFWYYATLAMFRHGGTPWDRWNTAMKETLLGAQERDGSWEPISIYAGYARDDDGDRSYTTAMCVLTLEIYYRYFTPLLKVE